MGLLLIDGKESCRFSTSGSRGRAKKGYTVTVEKGLWEPIRGRAGLPRERWAVSELVLNKHTADGQ